METLRLEARTILDPSKISNGSGMRDDLDLDLGRPSRIGIGNEKRVEVHVVGLFSRALCRKHVILAHIATSLCAEKVLKYAYRMS